MRLSMLGAAVIAALSLATVAAAQVTAAFPVRAGEWVYSSDGATLGRVDHVRKGKNGATAAAVIYQMKMVFIPADSLSPGQKGYVTKLTRAEVSRLK